MIGQEGIQNHLINRMANGTLPHSMILVGPLGSGRKTLLSELFAGVYPEDNKINSIRTIIAMCYNVHDRTFIIPDANELSTAAQNALLKILEEYPNNNSFILTVEDTSQLLPTIVSRCEVFHMDRYTPDEIFNYYWTVGDMPNDAELVRELCETPGEVLKCISMCKGTIVTFYDYVRLVIDHIATVSGSNVFKVADRVELKSDQSDKYDLKLFWKAFIRGCYHKFLSKQLSPKQTVDAIRTTEKCIAQLRSKGINKQMLFDVWLLDIRKEWM